MEIVEEIHEHVKKMPIEQARQVLDFIEFFEFKYQNTNAKNIEPADIMLHLQTSIKRNYRLGELLAK